MRKTVKRKFRQPDGSVVEREAVFVTPEDLAKQSPEAILEEQSEPTGDEPPEDKGGDPNGAGI